MHLVTKAYFCDLLIPQTSVQAWGQRGGRDRHSPCLQSIVSF